MTYFCTLQTALSLFADTTSINPDTYNIASTGYGKSPLESYQNAVSTSFNLYEQNLVQYILSKNYPSLQVENPLKCNIIYLDKQMDTPLPVPPQSYFIALNSIKNSVVVRNLDNSTSQYTDTATSTTNCLFSAMYYAVDSCNLNENKNCSSLYINSLITSSITNQ
jgi:hypothetical protein